MFFSNYIKKNQVLIFLFFEIFLFSIGLELIAKFLIFIFFILVYLFRLKHLFRENQNPSENNILAPVNGKILDIKTERNEHIVLLQVPWHVTFGVYLPVNGNVEDYKVSHGADVFRMSNVDEFYREKYYRGSELVVKTDFNATIKIKCIKCILGFFPDIWVRQGDKCKKKSIVGVMPFGGTLFLTLPGNYAIITKIGDLVIAGNTTLAISNSSQI